MALSYYNECFAQMSHDQ